MESQPQNPEFRIYPENFQPCAMQYFVPFLILLSSNWGRESWLLYFYCLQDIVTFSVLCLFLMVLLVGLQCVIVAFPGHTQLPF